MTTRVISGDVLVIGAGGAGCRAAISAATEGAKVILVAKGPVGRSGLTPMTMPGLAASLGTRDSQDSPEQHFKDTMKGGYHLNHASVARTLAYGAPEQVRFLEELGVRFDRTEKGEIEQLPLPGHTYRRGCWLDDNMGRILLNALTSEMARRGVRILEDIFVLDLLVEGGRVVGASAIDIRDGESLLLLGRGVVLASGGNEALYSFRTTSSRETGDGQAMAFRAGAQLIDMEFMQFNPYTILYPEAARCVLVPADTTLMAIGARYRNGQGETFLEKYDPERQEMTTRDVKTKAMYLEILAGRGSEHGGVYLDCTSLSPLDGLAPAEILRRQGGQVGRYLSLFGVDIHEGMFEIAPAAHFPCGGVLINERAQTTLPGLYAAGEVAGGCHGANRLDANSMPEVFVFGHIAGREAARHSLTSARVSPTPELTKAAHAHFQAALALIQARNDGNSPARLRGQLEETMFRCLGPIRDGAGMSDGKKTVVGLGKSHPAVTDKERRYNYQWIEALELRNMLLVAEMMFACALNREESRGGHYRRDFLDLKDELTQNSVVTNQGGKVQVSFRAPRPDEERVTVKE
ncbi:MAG: FAD-binding protein [Chloroflexi bacterium]|nr:FAD-binding protein [Chloroflexota bacterium]